jgi:hypothetical protein
MTSVVDGEAVYNPAKVVLCECWLLDDCHVRQVDKHVRQRTNCLHKENMQVGFYHLGDVLKYAKQIRPILTLLARNVGWICVSDEM